MLARGDYLEGKLKVSHVFQVCGFIIGEKGKTRMNFPFAIAKISLFPGVSDEITEPTDHDREFVADRPFIFFVEDDTTGATLISGIVNNPVF